MLLRITVFVTLFCCSGPSQSSSDAHSASDRAAIERLHQKDIAAAKVNDVDTLATLWTDDAVALPPGEQPVIGIDAIRAWLNKGRMDTDKVEITEYAMDFKEVHVAGNEAYEWARTSITMKPKGAPAGMRASGNLMRVLRRQPDGSWKVARAIWNMEKPSPAGASR